MNANWQRTFSMDALLNQALIDFCSFIEIEFELNLRHNLHGLARKC